MKTHLSSSSAGEGSHDDFRPVAGSPNVLDLTMVTCFNSSSSNSTTVSSDVAPFPGYTMVILAILMTTLVVVVVVGNALVILAFVVDKSLRNQCNYFFLNLAISDFLVGMYKRAFYLISTHNASYALFFCIAIVHEYKIFHHLKIKCMSSSIGNSFVLQYQSFL